MKNFFLAFVLFAMVFSVTVSVAHACMDIGKSIEKSSTHDASSSDDNESPLTSHDCEMACGSCCIHHNIFNNVSAVDSLISTVSTKPFPAKSDIILSKLAYSLKRPPKS